MSNKSNERNHSVDVEFYNLASKLYYQLLNGKGTIRTLCLAPSIKQKKKMVALLSETSKYDNLIKEILEKSSLLIIDKKTYPRVSSSLLSLLVHDYLWSKELNSDSVKSNRLLKNFLSSFPIINQNKTRIKAEWTKIKIKKGISSYTEWLKLSMDEKSVEGIDNDINASPNNNKLMIKYGRINTLKTNEKLTIESLINDGFTELSSIEFLNDSAFKKCFKKSKDVPNLLEFYYSKEIEFHQFQLVQEGKLIVQDKASCFPAIVLNPPLDSVVLDCCAAPGNKTTHLGMLMQNSGSLIAIERDKDRFEILKSFIKKAGVTNANLLLGDFLQINPEMPPYKNVEYILLDPSCSGSGMSAFQENETSDTASMRGRLSKLSNFQAKALKHALSFPNVKKVVYSTCSIFEEENECVVKESLSSFSDKFHLSKNVLNSWPRRGTPNILPDDLHLRLLRTDSVEDHCNGFFVALFERNDGC